MIKKLKKRYLCENGQCTQAALEDGCFLKEKNSLLADCTGDNPMSTSAPPGKRKRPIEEESPLSADYTGSDPMSGPVPPKKRKKPIEEQSSLSADHTGVGPMSVPAPPSNLGVLGWCTNENGECRVLVRPSLLPRKLPGILETNYY